MDLFKGRNLLEFVERFKTDSDCLKYLSQIKWSDGYKCVKCGHLGNQTRDNHARICNKCSHIESPTANTLFHKVKFGIRKSFCICFEMSTTTKSLSASYMAERYGVTEKTARLFMHKVRQAGTIQ
jgi:DNA-directed RNA polymerase subunit RPC12/RpoP